MTLNFRQLVVRRQHHSNYHHRHQKTAWPPQPLPPSRNNYRNNNRPLPVCRGEAARTNTALATFRRRLNAPMLLPLLPVLLPLLLLLFIVAAGGSCGASPSPGGCNKRYVSTDKKTRSEIITHTHSGGAYKSSQSPSSVKVSHYAG